MFKYSFFIMNLWLMSQNGFSELEPIELDEVAITATLTETSVQDVPASIQTLNISELRDKELPRTMPEVFKEMNGVLVQKTGHAQGSPFIRGFTSYHNVFLIDGIKLNNSVFRSGPNQYWGTVDPYSLEKVELLSAPASALYGSDAVGGTVQAFTKSLSYSEYKNNFEADVFARLASAEDSSILRLESASGVTNNTDFHLGVSFKNFGDLESGDGKLPNTGYDDNSYDFKLNYYFSESSYLTLARNRTKVDDAWRTHKTTSAVSFEGSSVGSEIHRILDQERVLSYLQFHHHVSYLLFDKLSLNISLHNQNEEQDRKRINKGDLKNDFQGFEVDTLGLWARFQKNVGNINWSYGIEKYSDKVDTYKYENNITKGTTSTKIQGAFGDDSVYDSTGIYIQLEANLTEKLNLILGSRYTKTELYSGKVEDENSNQISLSNDADAFVSNLKALYKITDHVNFYAGVAQSFRAPNLSDLTASFESGTTWMEIPVTQTNLDPEKFMTYDLGFKVNWAKLKAGISLYRTDTDSMITRMQTGLKDSITGLDLVTKTNSRKSHVHGIEFWLDKQVTETLLFHAHAAWIDGENEYVTPVGIAVNEPVSRMLPFTTQFSFIYEKLDSNWWSEFRTTIASKQDKLASNDKSDTSRIPPGGTPGYEVFTLRGGYKFNQKISMSLAVENIFDENYRVHGSGLNEPGRNFVLGANFKF